MSRSVRFDGWIWAAKPLGNSALVLEARANAARVLDARSATPQGSHPDQTDALLLAAAHQLARRIHRLRLALPQRHAIVDVLPAYRSVGVVSDGHMDIERFLIDLMALPDVDATPSDHREHIIPVCYEQGLDWDELAAHTGMAREEIIRRHLEPIYTVAMLGFMPGFVFLEGMDPAIAMPRRATPRTRVPPGAVGIAGRQTGLYSLESPGGWRILGRSPVTFFDAGQDPPTPLCAGDRVRFTRISEADADAARHDHVPSSRRTTRLAPTIAPDAISPLSSLEVLQHGLSTTIQDLGRTGHRVSGVPVSGVMDARSAALANRLVGNPVQAPVLEHTLSGGRYRFNADAQIALTGADMRPTVNGDAAPMNEAFQVRAGDELELGVAATGCRTYLAIAGGLLADIALGSASTYAPGGFGGFQGRAIQTGDVIRWSDPPSDRSARPHPATEAVDLSAAVRIPLMPGPEWSHLDDSSRAALLTTHWTIDSRSDRMGIRLLGEAIPPIDIEMRSSAVVPGVIQLPPDGQPILLMMDAQTIGGYPRIAVVPDHELWRAGQVRPGDRIRFELLAP